MTAISIRRGLCVSIAAVAHEFGHSRRTVTARIKAARLEPAGVRNGNAVYRLRDLTRVLRIGEYAVLDPENLPPFQRRAHFQAQHLALTLERLRAVLCDAADVEAENARFAGMVRRCFDTLPARLVRACDLSPDVEAVLTRYCQETLARLVDDDVSESSPSPGQGTAVATKPEIPITGETGRYLE
jgi:histidine ammonia-lyase